jgi:hypothetical protein
MILLCRAIWGYLWICPMCKWLFGAICGSAPCVSVRVYYASIAKLVLISRPGSCWPPTAHTQEATLSTTTAADLRPHRRNAGANGARSSQNPRRTGGVRRGLRAEGCASPPKVGRSGREVAALGEHVGAGLALLGAASPRGSCTTLTAPSGSSRARQPIGRTPRAQAAPVS